MEIFINELSLHEQYASHENFAQAVKQFLEVFSLIQDKVQQKEMFKDELFILQQALTNETFQQSFERIKNRELKEAFRRIIFNKLNPKNWQVERAHSSEILYTAEQCVVQENFVTDTSVAEIAERKLQNPQKRYVLINFEQSQFDNCQSFEVKKEDDNTIIIDIECIETKTAFEKWLGLSITPLDIFLRNAERFTRTKFKQQGATVFQEKDTAYYWYIDNLHKDEFEVFNANREHIGTATLDGIIQYEYRKIGRTINL
jgi:hypothetical protein